ncbi:hypothetical protein EDC01DRAFT_758020 [Geopyxis carbonaria]|nr:hypothetical protein EDC01DRAFT_758020 [Geopyxis carbonaria]
MRSPHHSPSPVRTATPAVRPSPHHPSASHTIRCTPPLPGPKTPHAPTHPHPAIAPIHHQRPSNCHSHRAPPPPPPPPAATPPDALAMPPRLHPKSLSTASLFTSTALLAFLVVGAPHLLPCPAPRRAFADAGEREDGDGERGGVNKCPVPRIGAGKEERREREVVVMAKGEEGGR